MQIVARKEAIRTGLRRYFTGKPCRNGHVAERDVGNRTCLDCSNERSARNRADNPEYYANYRKHHRELAGSYNNSYYSDNAAELSAYARVYRRDNAETVRASDRARAKTVNRKQQAKLFRESNRQAIRDRENRRYLREGDRIKKRVTKYRRENPQKVRAALKVCTARARAQRRKAIGSHTSDDIKQLFQRQNGICAACSVSIADGCHLDHIVPLKRGGTNNPDNLQLLCQPCNLSKGSKTMSEWTIWKEERDSLLF